MAATPAITVTDLYKSYLRGTTLSPVLEGVQLTIERGNCAFLAGPSGSGKTTLLSILGCMLTPDYGNVRILSHDLHELDTHRRTRLRNEKIGFVFQKFHLVRGLSAIENVCVPMMLRGVSNRVAKARAMNLLESVGLEEHLHKQPGRMSTGQCQRVAVARALANDPELILADEPTASLDAESGLEVMRLLRSLAKEQQKTVIIVTHDPRIFPFADCIYHMQGGRVAMTEAEGLRLSSQGGLLHA